MSEISKESKILLAGVIFGDGYITKRGTIGFHHSIRQRDYVDYKTTFLDNNFGVKFKSRVRNDRSGFSTNDGYEAVSHPKSFIKGLRNEWYLESKKNIPSDITSQFGFLEWSFVYQDDGRLNKIGHYNTKKAGERVRVEVDPYVNRYEICLGHPSDETLDSLIFSLSCLNVESTVLNRKDGQRNLSISRKDSKIAFYNGVLEHMCPDMLYKTAIRPTLSYEL